MRGVTSVMARRLHPNDTRKVRNALRSFDKHGVPHSERLAAQAASAAAGDHYGATAPPYDARLLWLDCAPEVHAERLSARVDGMVEAGLLRELRQLRALLREHFADKGGVPEGFTSGLLQAIGYKEFAPYLDLVDDGEGDGVGEGEGEGEGEARAVLAECVERLKRVTRRYAKKQRAWIRNRCVGSACSSSPLAVAGECLLTLMCTNDARTAASSRAACRCCASTRRTCRSGTSWCSAPRRPTCGGCWPASSTGTRPRPARASCPTPATRTASSRGASLTARCVRAIVRLCVCASHACMRFFCFCCGCAGVPVWVGSRVSRAAQVCGRTLNGEHEWNVHLKSRAHARRARKRRREEADAEASAPAPAASTSTSTADE